MSDVNENAVKEAGTTTPARDTANGVTRPKAGTKTGRVWELADQMSEANGGRARRKDVMAACEAEDLNAATAATQYGRWRKYNGLEGRDEVEVDESLVDDSATQAVREAVSSAEENVAQAGVEAE